MEQARIEYSKIDKRYSLVLQMYKDNLNTTSVPLKLDVFKSLIRLMKQEGKIQKILSRMETENDRIWKLKNKLWPDKSKQ